VFSESEKEKNQQSMLKNILNGMEALICVCDSDNFDILFLNDSIRDNFGIKSDGVGQKCYKLLQGLDEPCPTCPYLQLHQAPGKTIIWEHEERINGSILRKTARFIEWSNGKKAHLEYAIDISELRKVQKTLKYQNTVLLAISYISSVLLQSSSETFEGDLLHSMEIMGEAAEVDRVYIWRNHMNGEELCASQIYEWSNGAEPQQNKELVQNVPYKEGMPHWEMILSRGNCINGLTREQPDSTKEILSSQGILSILVVPIFIHDQFWGFVGFDDCHDERVFSKNEEKILRSASELMTNAFIRNQLEKDIQHLEMEVDKIYYDPLTGIYNRRYFNENIDYIVKTLSRSSGILSLLMVDIDFFKKYNDTYGHVKGDECLQVIAETLRSSTMRKEDFVARYGGEEFVVVLPNTDEAGAAIVAERMIENVRNHNIPHTENVDEQRITISIGVITGEAKQSFTAKDFINRADALLYEAKRDGRNKYICASL
jgi:diguanylate cyclase (GGDEF)-like protein